ncbi:MAG TPA: hypothetical protein VF459_11490 [Caulobacteraceae bacterium]
MAEATLRVAAETLWATLALGLPSLVIALVALYVARTALKNADRNSSAAQVVALQDAISVGWRRFLTTIEASWKDHEFAELINVFETAASLHQEGALQGKAKKMVYLHLCNSLELISENDEARARIAKLREAPVTFEYLVDFVKEAKKRGRVTEFAALIDMVPKPAP